MKKTIALLLICLVSGLSNYVFAAQKIMTVHQRAAGVEATTDNTIPGFQDFARADDSTGVAVDGTGTTLTLGGARDTDGAIWYGGDSDAGYCVNGKCDFGIGIRAYFEFRFDEDTHYRSQDKGQGFTFAIINGSNNDRTKRGGNPEREDWQSLMAYAGPGNTTDGLGLQPPKMAIEFDTYPNTGTDARCNNDGRVNNNRADASNYYNHIALMLWGGNPGGTCSGGYPAVSYDDNRHDAGTIGSSTFPRNSYRNDGTGGYYERARDTYNWLEDGVTHSFRIEIIRESVSSDNIGNYTVKAWVDCTGCTPAQLAAFQDTSLPFITNPTVLPQINRTVELSSALHTAFNKMLFGFTQATSSTTSQAQNIEITNFNIYFPQCNSDWPPGEGWTYCAEENGTCSFTGTKLVAYGRNCFYNYLYRTGSVGCNNATFGDPHVNVYKKCYYK